MWACLTEMFLNLVKDSLSFCALDITHSLARTFPGSVTLYIALRQSALLVA